MNGVVMIRIPEVGVQPEGKPGRCGGGGGSRLERWGRSKRRVGDVEAVRWRCRDCGRTMGEYPGGVGRASQTERVRVLGVDGAGRPGGWSSPWTWARTGRWPKPWGCGIGSDDPRPESFARRGPEVGRTRAPDGPAPEALGEAGPAGAPALAPGPGIHGCPRPSTHNRTEPSIGRVKFRLRPTRGLKTWAGVEAAFWLPPASALLL